jgi:hypothetical protein
VTFCATVSAQTLASTETVSAQRLAAPVPWVALAAVRSVQVYDSYAANTSTRWTSQPSIFSKWAEVFAAAGFSSACPARGYGIDISSLVQYWAGTGAPSGSIMLRAANETDGGAYKVYGSSETSTDPYITFTYDRAPSVPAVPTVGAPATSYTSAGSTTAVTYTSDLTPDIAMTGTDPVGLTHTQAR